MPLKVFNQSWVDTVIYYIHCITSLHVLYNLKTPSNAPELGGLGHSGIDGGADKVIHSDHFIGRAKI